MIYKEFSTELSFITIILPKGRNWIQVPSDLTEPYLIDTDYRRKTAIG